VQLRDGRLLLRRATDDDVAAIAAACNDPELVRFLPNFPTPYTEEDARTYVRHTQRRWHAGETRGFLIVDAEDGTLLGAIEVRLGEVGSIGYWVAAPARGRGVATQAVKLLAHWALTEGAVERLELTTDPDNRASQRVAEKAGFVREGILRAALRFGDTRRDSVMFSLLPGELA
jgi:RimJ/RimL family protein N-acetyltransferase